LEDHQQIYITDFGRLSIKLLVVFRRAQRKPLIISGFRKTASPFLPASEDRPTNLLAVFQRVWIKIRRQN